MMGRGFFAPVSSFIVVSSMVDQSQVLRMSIGMEGSLSENKFGDKNFLESRFSFAPEPPFSATHTISRSLGATSPFGG